MAEDHPTPSPDQSGDSTAPKARVPAQPADKDEPPPRKRTTKATKASKTAKASKAAKASSRPAGKRAAARGPGDNAGAELAAVPPGAWPAAAWETLRCPEQPPRQLAELAVREFGPRAAAWAAWLRKTYPDAAPAGLARLAARQAGRLGLTVAALEAGGPTAAPVHLAATAWLRAALVLRIAAAYGHDPTAPDRAAELLELLRLDVPEPERQPAVSALPTGRLGLACHAVSWVARRRRTHFTAAVRLLFAAGEQSESLEQLAHRAIRRYRTYPGSQSS